MDDDVRRLAHGEQRRRLSFFGDVEVGGAVRVRRVLEHLGEIQVAVSGGREVSQAVVERSVHRAARGWHLRRSRSAALAHDIGDGRASDRNLHPGRCSGTE